MATYQWAPTPAPVSALAERPRCWGKEYNDVARECRGCGFQNSCKEEIVRQNVNRGQQTVPFYQPATQMQAPTHVPVYAPAPQPVQQVPQYQQVPFNTQVARTVQAIPPQAQPQPVVPARTVQVMPAPQNYGYGWIQDPLAYTLASCPPPVRHQMPGETFMERAAKNTALAMAETFFGQCMLAVRQYVWAPDAPEPKTIDQK